MKYKAATDFEHFNEISLPKNCININLGFKFGKPLAALHFLCIMSLNQITVKVILSCKWRKNELRILQAIKELYFEI